ncbi:MAG: ABC transporter substrate-binding protein [Methylobacteriaceae bacterium]|nr:ABC transporter substrate-binding protein [Methylobacteriaceae bacterium]
MNTLKYCTALACSLLAVSAVQAQQKILTVGGYGGSYEVLLKEKIIPPFEAKYNVKVVYVPGNSTENLAKLQAQKGNQEIDVVLLDDGPMYQADGLGFCAPLTPAKIYDDIYDLAKISPNAVGYGIGVTGIAYSEDWFKKEGWEPPTSLNDLLDPKYDQIMSIPPITNSYGLHALIMFARLNGGGEKNIDPGFAVFKDKLAPRVLAFEASSGKMSELFQSGESAIAVWGNGRTKAVTDSGFKLGFAYPKEGSMALMVAACPIVDSDVPEEAQAFVQYMLEPQNQLPLADNQALAPVNKHAELSAELQAYMPYGEEDIKGLLVPDWKTVNPLRDEWTKRWAREIER